MLGTWLLAPFLMSSSTPVNKILGRYLLKNITSKIIACWQVLTWCTRCFFTICQVAGENRSEKDKPTPVHEQSPSITCLYELDQRSGASCWTSRRIHLGQEQNRKAIKSLLCCFCSSFNQEIKILDSTDLWSIYANLTISPIITQ